MHARHLSLLGKRRSFHRTSSAENPRIIALALLMGAGAWVARYVVRAAKRAAAEDPDSESDQTPGAQPSKEHDMVHRTFPVVGLDIGSLQACIAVVPDKGLGPLIIENHEGRRSTPAFLAWEDGNLIVGQLARKSRWRHPEKVAYDVQRLLAAQYSPGLRSSYSFKVEPAGHDPAEISLHLSGEPRHIAPKEACARILEHLTHTAEVRLGHAPRLAVLGIPSYLKAEKRERFLQAAREGIGLKDSSMELIEDSIVSLIAAHFSGIMPKGAQLFSEKGWLVVDVGGLCSQLTIARASVDQGLKVCVNQTVWNVGGEMLDLKLAEHLAEVFRTRHAGIELSKDYLAVERLYEASEAAKIELSSKYTSEIHLPFISADQTGPKHLDVDLSRRKYESLIEPILARLEQPFKKLLEEANLSSAMELEGVLLTGGTSRLPPVVEYVRKLTGVEPVTGEAPEENVAIGCAYIGRELI